MSFFFGNPYFRSTPVYLPQYQQRPNYGFHHPGYYYEEDNSDEEGEDFGYSNFPFVHQKRPVYDRDAVIREMQLRQKRQEEAERERQRLEQQRILELKRKQQLIMELQKKRQAEERAAKETLLLKRKATFLRYNHAAEVIQRAFRLHYQKLLAVQSQAASVIQAAYRKRLAEKKENAAFVIQRALKANQLKQEAKRVTGKLRLLSKIRSQVESFRHQYEGQVLSKPVYEKNPNNGTVLPNKDYLIYEDNLLKALINLDGVLSEGSEIVRDQRKLVISRAQLLLSKLDQHKNQKQVTFEMELDDNQGEEEDKEKEVVQMDEK